MATFTKSITPQFEQVGRKQKLVGQLGEIRDETGILIHSQSYDTKPQAEQALDDLVYDLLLDYADRGLVDTLPVADVNWNSAHIDPVTAHTAQCLANRLQTPAYVVAQHGHFLIQDDADLEVYGGRADVVATYQPEVADQPPVIAFPRCPACLTCEYPLSSLIPDLCIVCSNARFFGLHDRFAASRIAAQQPRAVTRASMAIDQAAQRNRICANCQGAHFTWQCPEVARRLFADDTSWKDIALGRELCRMKWKNFKAFVALLLSVPAEHLIIYAASYQAFVRSCRPESDMTINQVLEAWARDMRRGGDRGPAALSAAA